ncbi:MAG: formimidoylglutamase, partial [Halobacteriaceae archaeon]
APREWSGVSEDPRDEQFGDVIQGIHMNGIDEFAAVLVGEPYDGGVIGRKGARRGPSAIRDALATLKTNHFSHGKIRNIGDLGDIDMSADDTDVAGVQEVVKKVAEKVHRRDVTPIFIGGDNSLSYPNASPLLDRSLGVINLDAHLDCREVRSDAGPTSGTPYRQLLEEGLDQYIVLGARHFETTRQYQEYAEERGGKIIMANEMRENWKMVLNSIEDALTEMDHVHFSIDMDVLDASCGPGVSAPTPGGITSRELFDIVHRVAATIPISSFEVVECAPKYDESNLTARAAASSIGHFLAGSIESGT